MSIRNLLVILTMLAGLGGTVSTAGADRAPGSQITAVAERAPASTPARERGDAARYADREAAAKGQADFQGGNFVIYLSTGAAILIGVIVLLLI